MWLKLFRDFSHSGQDIFHSTANTGTLTFLQQWSSYLQQLCHVQKQKLKSMMARGSHFEFDQVEILQGIFRHLPLYISP